MVVALSGGADSVVLLHLLRFTPGLESLRVTAAHVDHGMRPESASDAAWVAGLCRAWGVPVRACRLDPAPSGEAEARRLRYAWLEEVRREEGARWVVTAHHADDQAETVLFRAVRGSGITGLQGIQERRAPGIWRPLLPFTRRALRAYADLHRLTWREDATNRLPMARNVLRHRVLPALEEGVAPGTREALAGLARRAHQDEAAWQSIEPALLDAAGARAEDRGISLDRAAFVSLHPAVRARLLRGLARRLGGVPGEAGTRRAVEFTSAGASGGAVPLGGGLQLRREFDRLVVCPAEIPSSDAEATIPSRGEGSAEVVVGSGRYRVWWRAGAAAEEEEGVFSRGGLSFPLTVRGWRPGDRVRLAYGSKKLKKILLEARVPAGERNRVPVVVDATGAVLWVPGVIQAMGTGPNDDDMLTIGIDQCPS